MEDILMICNDPECVCDDKCCQECEKVSCENRCDSVRYKEKIYSSDDYLIKELDELAERLDNWLIAVAAEKIRSLTNLNAED